MRISQPDLILSANSDHGIAVEVPGFKPFCATLPG